MLSVKDTQYLLCRAIRIAFPCTLFHIQLLFFNCYFILQLWITSVTTLSVFQLIYTDSFPTICGLCHLYLQCLSQPIVNIEDSDPREFCGWLTPFENYKTVSFIPLHLLRILLWTKLCPEGGICSGTNRTFCLLEKPINILYKPYQGEDWSTRLKFKKFWVIRTSYSQKICNFIHFHL